MSTARARPVVESSIPESSLRAAVHHAPQVGQAGRWMLDGLALTLATTPDAAAWVQLGATLEAISIASGLRVDARPVASARQLALHVDARALPGTSRLAACLERATTAFAVPSRVAAHVPARLGAAAAVHASTLIWLDVSSAVAELAELAATGAPANTCAAGVIRAHDTAATSLVSAGRAACRVCLEAISLGLATLPAMPLPASHRYRAFVPEEPGTVDAAMLWFGCAA